MKSTKVQTSPISINRALRLWEVISAKSGLCVWRGAHDWRGGCEAIGGACAQDRTGMYNRRGGSR